MKKILSIVLSLMFVFLITSTSWVFADTSTSEPTSVSDEERIERESTPTRQALLLSGFVLVWSGASWCYIKKENQKNEKKEVDN